MLINVIGGALWLSGLGWILFHYFVRVKSEFGPGPSPYEPWWLKIHGAAAFGALFTFGILWALHVLKGWVSGQRRYSGGGLVALLIVLTVTGYLLYYAGSDELRSAVSLMHWIPGLALPLIYLIHRLQVAKARRERHGRSTERAHGGGAPHSEAAVRASQRR
jgi:hypothetical protein